VRLDRPILITGTPRSGKSLLARILNESKRVTWIREPRGLWSLEKETSDDCWDPNEVGAADVSKINSSCQTRIGISGNQRYLDDLVLHSLRFEATLKIVPSARLVLMMRDPAMILPELTSYWKGRNVRYAISNRLKKDFSARHIPGQTWKFLRNRASLEFYGRVSYVGPILSSVKQLPLKFSAVEMATNQLDAMLTTATNGMESVTSQQCMKVRYEDVCKHDDGAFRKDSFSL